MKSIKVSDTFQKLSKEQAAKEQRFVWQVADDALAEYLKKRAKKKL